MLSPACGVFIMQYASNAHAASARSYEFGMNSLSRLRERAGVRELLPLLLAPTLTLPQRGREQK